MAPKERIILRAEGAKIVASYYSAEGNQAIILLHQLRLDKSSWDAFALELQGRGHPVVALDFRGHGESDGDWQQFTDKEFVAMLSDVEAAATFLHNKEKSVAVVMGASIGANTAFRYSSLHKTPAVLLSPGLAYRGIDINDVTSAAPILIVVAEGDTYSYNSSRELDQNNCFGGHELLILPGTAHGTFLLDEQEVHDRLLAFVDEHAK